MNHKIPFTIDLLHPKHWLTWIVVGIIFLLGKLPLNAKYWLGEKLGLLCIKLFPSRYHIAFQNISACFSELTEEEQHDITRKNFIATVQGGFETFHAWWGNCQPIFDDLTVEGAEHVKQAEADGKGVFLIGGHYSIFDLAMPVIAMCANKPGYMYRPNGNLIINRVIENGRRQHFSVTPFTKRETSKMVEFLSEGGTVWYACDQDLGKKSDLFVPFFGVPAACISAPTTTAKRTGAAVIYVSQYRIAPGKYKIVFSPTQTKFGEDAQADAVSWNKWLEQSIRKHPEQYLWMHKRFKTRPVGMKPFYTKYKT